MNTKNRELKKIRSQVGAAQRREAQTSANTPISWQSWQDALKRLKLADIKKRAPGFYEASGGDKMKIKGYTDRTANGLTRCIIDFLTFSGHYANRINTQGQARVKRIPKFNILSGKVEHHEKVQFTKSMTAKGTPDIDSIIFGRAAKIEVKVGADKIRDEQAEQGQRIEAAGGMYFVATDMPLFLEWFFTNFRTFN